MLERGAKEVSAKSSIGLLFSHYESQGIPSDGRVCSPSAQYKTTPNDTRVIPVVSWAHAGEAAAYEELPESWREKVPTECRDPKAFAVRLEGDSMESTHGLSFREGDVLVVQPSETAHSGCLVVARFRNDGVIFRRFEVTNKAITLVPLNNRYQASQHQIDEFSWIYPVWGRWTQIWRK
jgi:SOS-response transcriptional repressor LexA